MANVFANKVSKGLMAFAPIELI